MNNKDKEVIEEFRKEITDEIDLPHMECSYECGKKSYSVEILDRLCDHFKEALQSTREDERTHLREVLEQLREMVDGTDRMLVEYIDDTITGLALTPLPPKE